ncbi:MAG: hypothetical protein EZS28_015074 [Streblomastix strix]|uniref:Uncharacterized protein n=1 Tax=Streblomastix strix TaxID=222440 RepID=A0A5J4W3B2_9EUKA|nr:MAG: hypothetical protein EZS28_015074 [Streblomastix strix]
MLNVCSTTTLCRKFNLHLDTDEGRRLRAPIIRSGQQWSLVTRNSTIACVETNIGTMNSRLSQPARRPILRNCDGTRTTDSVASDVCVNPDYISMLLATTRTMTQIQYLFQGFGLYSGKQQFLGFPQLGLFQLAQPSPCYSIQLYRQPSITEGLRQFMQNSPIFGMQYTQSNLLVSLILSSVGYLAFKSSFQNQNSEQLNQQYYQLPIIRPPTLVQQKNQDQEPRYVNGKLIDSHGTALKAGIAQDQQQLWNKQCT